MPAHPSRSGMAPATKWLLGFSALLSLVFWAGVIAGKLHFGFGMTSLPLIPEVALAVILGIALALGVGACLLEEKRRDDDALAHDTTTKGDMK